MYQVYLRLDATNKVYLNDANNFDETIKLKISFKRIKNEYSELEILERCLTLEKVF